jgi:hypothetical protein
MRTRPSFLFLVTVLFLAVAPGLRAAIEKDLGNSLVYYRITDAQADRTAVLDKIAHRPALVLDLRCLSVSEGFVDALQTVLARTPPPHAARIVLINATTSPALVAMLGTELPYLITIGPRSTSVTPDVAVAISDEEDRRAFAALANGVDLEKLINDNREKRRYDEAKLVQDHSNGITPPDSVLPADAEDDTVKTEPTNSKKESSSAKKVEPAPLIDLVLERAVQLHRSLLALKKL